MFDVATEQYETDEEEFMEKEVSKEVTTLESRKAMNTAKQETRLSKGEKSNTTVLHCLQSRLLTDLYEPMVEWKEKGRRNTEPACGSGDQEGEECKCVDK